MTPPILPDDGIIGDELAHEIVAYIKQHGQPVLDDARAWLESRSTASTTSSPQSAAQIAKMAIHPSMGSICVGIEYRGRGGLGPMAAYQVGRDGTFFWTKGGKIK